MDERTRDRHEKREKRPTPPRTKKGERPTSPSPSLRIKLRRLYSFSSPETRRWYMVSLAASSNASSSGSSVASP